MYSNNNNSIKNVNIISIVDCIMNLFFWHFNSSDIGIFLDSDSSDDLFDFGDIEDVDFNSSCFFFFCESSILLDYYFYLLVFVI